MTYKEYLELQKEFNMDPYKLVSAEAVNSHFPKLSTDDFENVSDFVYDWITSTSMDANELCQLIKTSISNDEISWNDFKNNWNYIIDILNNKI